MTRAITAQAGTFSFTSGILGAASGASSNKGSAMISASGSSLSALSRARGEWLVNTEFRPRTRVSELLGRRALRIQAGILILADITAESVVSGPWLERDRWFAVTDEDDPHPPCQRASHVTC